MKNQACISHLIVGVSYQTCFMQNVCLIVVSHLFYSNITLLTSVELFLFYTGQRSASGSGCFTSGRLQVMSYGVFSAGQTTLSFGLVVECPLQR